MPNPEFKRPTPFTEQDILDIERLIGRELPEDYRKFAKEYGGCLVDGEVDGSAKFGIDAFYKAHAYTKQGGDVPEWDEYREIGALPFAKCILGNLYVLTNENEVHYVNYYGGETTTQKLATSFGDFISRIEPSKYMDEE